jgi:glycosyltransferase involved in cell wall biosynthesis
VKRLNHNSPCDYDAVVMLTLSDWHKEPRSNRYHYATRFARTSRVIFVQPDRKTTGYTYEESNHRGIEILHVPQDFGSRQAAAITRALLERQILRPLFWLYSADYLDVIEHIFSPIRILHATEDWFSEEMRRQMPPTFFKRLPVLLNKIDLLVAVSSGVLESYVHRGGYRGNTLLLENGCDFSFYREIINRSKGTTTNEPSTTRPVAFYQGGINYRFDFALFNDLARRRPDWDFRLCGAQTQPGKIWSELVALPNVVDLGILSPEQVADEAHRATVGIIPFVQTPLIQRRSLPLKAFEYVACGLPVVTIPIDSLARWPDVFLFASNAAEFSSQLDESRRLRSDPIATANRMKIAAAQDYDKRFAELITKIEQLSIADSSSISKLNILFLYAANSTYTSTVQEYLSCFAKYSTNNMLFAEAVRDAACHYEMSLFDVVFVHYSVRLTLDNYISPSIVDALQSCGSYKVLFIQDEYENTECSRRWMEKIGFHAVFTCVPEGQVHCIYPPERFPSTEFSTILTGYVPPTLERMNSALPLEERPILVGYRGRQLPFRYGELAQEKYQIGLQMKSLCRQRGIECDIEWTEDKRIYGDKWYEFIGNCRAMLGSESGSNIFDFDGELSRRSEDIVADNPNITFEEFRAKVLHGIDGKYRMNQVSPRVFEAIACRTPLILFEGEYSGVVRPGEHYLALKKDFSNADQVLNKLADIDELKLMSERAYRDVIASGRYSYRNFVAKVDEFLSNRIRFKKPWLSLLISVDKIREDVHEDPRLEHLRVYRGTAVSWPLSHKHLSEEPIPASDTHFAQAGGVSKPYEANDVLAVSGMSPATIDNGSLAVTQTLINFRTRTLQVEVLRRAALLIVENIPASLRGFFRYTFIRLARIAKLI